MVLQGQFLLPSLDLYPLGKGWCSWDRWCWSSFVCPVVKRDKICPETCLCVKMENQEENPEMHIWFRFSMWCFSSSVTAPAALTQPKWSNLSKRSKKTDQISDQILPQVLSLSTNDGPPLRDQNTHWVELCWLSRGGGCMHKWSLKYVLLSLRTFNPLSPLIYFHNQHSFFSLFLDRADVLFAASRESSVTW